MNRDERPSVKNLSARPCARALALLVLLLLPAAARAQWTTPDANGNVSSTNTGNVGIGTASPAGKLDVSDDLRVGAGRLRFTFSGPEGRVQGATERLSFSTPDLNNTAQLTRMRLGGLAANSTVEFLNVSSVFLSSASAKFGVGTSNPTSKFHLVSGTDNATSMLHMDTGLHGGTAFAVGGTANNESTLDMSVYRAGAYVSRFGVNNSGNVYLQPGGGNVGIGTSSPQDRLHVSGSLRVQGASANGDITVMTADGVTGKWDFFTLGSNGSTGFYDIVSGTVPLTVEKGTPTNTLYATALGRVGVGNPAPAFKLDVAGSVNASGLCLSGVCKNDWSQVGGQWSANSGGTGINYNGGNVGVGTSAPASRLTVNLSNTDYANAGGANSHLLMTNPIPTGQNVLSSVINGAVVAKWRTDWVGNISSVAGGAGEHYFFTGGDYGVGQLRMTIRNDGRVGIGTPSPSYKLHVSEGSVGVQNAGGDAVVVATSGAANELLTSGWSTAGFGYVQGGSWGAAVKNLVLQGGGGNVGIGTTSPSSNLHVYAPASSSPVGAASVDVLSFNTHANSLNSYFFRVRDLGAASTPFYIRGDGNVGIGTASPLAKLEVRGGADTAVLIGDRGAGGKVGLQFLGSGVSHAGITFDGNGLTVENASNTHTPSNWHPVGYPMNFTVRTGKLGVNTGDALPAHTLEVNGTINASGGITGATINAVYQDVAEWVPSTQKLSAGTVVVLDPDRTNHVLASTSAYDMKVAGVISDTPGVILGVGGEDKLKVATTGRVKVRVDATRAPVKVGDLLVTGEIEGVAMKSVEVDLGGVKMHRPGTIIGKALEPLASGKGEILVLLSLQ